MTTTAENLLDRLWDWGVVPTMAYGRDALDLWFYPQATPPEALMAELRANEEVVKEVLRKGFYRFPKRWCRNQPETETSKCQKKKKK